MHALNFRLDQNVLGFLEDYAIPKNYERLIEDKSEICLSDPAVEHFLHQGHFPRVLTALWREQDLSKRVAWLVSKSPALHPILMYEEAIDKFILQPSEEQLIQESLPLFDAAYFRVCQDAECSLNPEVKTSIKERINERYRTRLSCLVYRHLRQPFTILEPTIKKREINAARVQQVAKETLQKELGSPIWIGYCGMNLFSVGRPAMIPPHLFQETRRNYAQERLSSR
jgi:hypothetical protein